MTNKEKQAIKEVEKFNLNNRFRDCGKLNNSINTALNLIRKQDKIIVLMTKFIEDNCMTDEFCNKKDCYADKYEDGHCQKCLNCMKEYFRRQI